MSNTIEKLNVVLANANVLFTKLHNYHWHVKGPAFFQLHLKTEEYYTRFATMYDDVAERILQLEGKPLVTLKDILAKATILEEEKTEFSVEYILKSIMADFKEMQMQFQAISADEATDDITRAYTDEQIGLIEKDLWMLKSSL
ncbi:Dps family protein [Parendozoicomonas haliclonae]|uniref:DNA protection during starvation protein n=1 Tax=Parendozoicomonas haliclonae TaxID=1960125 RepID=A0A1X7ADQ8_9GAMM|nr:DNA starvation/stationary phase protection protein [Parendozoicomonas haliclonae]SMA31889.1 DNA protection during starvation protein [Parendozoicomonas haliclonae]